MTFEDAMDNTDLPVGGTLIAEVRRSVAAIEEKGDTIGISGSGHIRVLQEAVEALATLIAAHHSRLRAIELRQHGVKEEDIW